MRKHIRLGIKVIHFTMKSIQAYITTKVILYAMFILSNLILLRLDHRKKVSSFSIVIFKKTNVFILGKRYIFITNSYIEAYHNQLKSCYFGRTKHSRMDRMIILFHKLYYWLSTRYCTRMLNAIDRKES